GRVSGISASGPARLRRAGWVSGSAEWRIFAAARMASGTRHRRALLAGRAGALLQSRPPAPDAPAVVAEIGAAVPRPAVEGEARTVGRKRDEYDRDEIGKPQQL